MRLLPDGPVLEVPSGHRLTLELPRGFLRRSWWLTVTVDEGTSVELTREKPDERTDT